MLKLIIEDDEGRKTVVPFMRDEITIGRQEGNTIRLTERNVSRRHAKLVRQNGHVLVEDLGSYNGIKINGDKIQGQVPVHDGDLIQIGDYDLAVQREETAQSGAPTLQLAPVRSDTLPPLAALGNGGATVKLPELNETIPALPAVQDPTLPAMASPLSMSDDEPEEAAQEDVRSGETDLAKRHATAIIRMDQVEGSKPRQIEELDPAEAPRLVVINTDFAGREFACIRTELKIGRTDDNDIAIDHRSLSRTHCKVVREEGNEWRVIDMQSANGLMVNGEPYAQSALRPGDVLELGHVKLKFVGAGETFNLSGAGSSSNRSVSSSGGGTSRVPLVLAGVAVIILLGAVGWFITRPPPSGPVIPPKPANDTGTASPKTPEELTPEEQRAETERRLARARESIEKGDWKAAEDTLKGCRIGDSVCPEARNLLNEMEGEKGLKTALDTAEAALAAGDIEKAQLNLASAGHTNLLGSRLDALKSRLQDAVSKKMMEKKNPPVTPVVEKPATPKPPAEPANVVEARALYEEGVKMANAKQWAVARGSFKKCVEKDPTNFECHKLLGAAYATLKEPETGLKHYRLFLKLAPKDHPSIPKVKQIIDQYEGSK